MKTNRYIYVLLGFVIFMSFILGTIFRKYTLLLFHHSVYICQGIFNVLPVRLPENLGETGVLVLVIMFLFTVIKLTASWIKNSRTHKHFGTSTVRNDVVEKLGSRLDLHKKILVCQSNHPFAFCFGFINPKIYISTGLVKILSKKELEAVLRHEKYHLSNKDALVGFFATIIQSLFPFFPIIADIAKHYRIQNEIAADRSAIIAMGSSEPLISVLRKIVAYEPLKPFAFTNFLAEWDTLEIRIRRLVNKEVENKSMATGNLLVSLLSLLILSILLISPVRAYEFHAKNEDSLVLCGLNQSCTNICREEIMASFSHI